MVEGRVGSRRGRSLHAWPSTRLAPRIEARRRSRVAARHEGSSLRPAGCREGCRLVRPAHPQDHLRRPGRSRGSAKPRSEATDPTRRSPARDGADRTRHRGVSYERPRPLSAARAHRRSAARPPRARGVAAAPEPFRPRVPPRSPRARRCLSGPRPSRIPRVHRCPRGGSHRQADRGSPRDVRGTSSSHRVRTRGGPGR